jgi:tRNA A37 threonylcarbamoyladenosine modification protein TsaB
VHGICSLDAIAYGIDLPEFIVATDARRKELYWARYIDGKRIGDPLVTAPSEIPKLPIFGEGALKYSLSSDNQHLYPKVISFPELSHVYEPMYLRHPDAVPTADRK